MAEKYELDRWAAVVCNGFTAVNVMSSGNVEELGWDYTEMELDPTGTCGLFDGMLLDWDDDTPAERRDHEAYFPDAFTVGARILADDWDHELGNDEVRSRCFAIIEDADQFTDHDTARDWLCESTMADFSEVEARTFFQNLTLMDSEEIAKLNGRPIIPSAGAEECRAAVLAFNERMVPRRRELGLGDAAVVDEAKKAAAFPKPVPRKREQAVHGLGRVDFPGLGYGWGTKYPDSLSVDAIGIDHPSGERNVILNFSPITHALDVDGRKFFCHETTIGYDLNADSWSGATIGPDFWTLDGKEAREFAEKIGLDRLAARACGRFGIEAPGLRGREALPVPKAADVAPEPSAQAEAAKKAAIYDEMRYTAEHTDPADIRIAEGSTSMTGALMAAAMASYDLSCGLIDDEHIGRYSDVITALEERMGVGAGGLSVQTEAGELIANAKEDGISVGINIPGGKCADIAFVDADPGADDLYPTPVRAFTYNGRDEEPDHRTDVHLDGDMVLDGQMTAETPAHVPADIAVVAKEAAAKSVKPDTVGTDDIKH